MNRGTKIFLLLGIVYFIVAIFIGLQGCLNSDYTKFVCDFNEFLLKLNILAVPAWILFLLAWLSKNYKK